MRRQNPNAIASWRPRLPPPSPIWRFRF
jgi:hypothetical protein